MEKFTITIGLDNKICDYLQLLNLNITSRERLISISARDNGIVSDITKAYEREFMIYDAKYNLAKEKISRSVPEVLQPYTEWSIDFFTSKISFSIAKDAWDSYVATNGDNSLEWLSSSDIVDNLVADELNKIYDSTDFDDEKGLLL